MICDDFERSIEASMDDLDQLEYLTADDVKPSRFHKTMLPEIQENSPLESPPPGRAYRAPEMIHRKTWSSLSMPFQERRRLSQCKEEDGDEDGGDRSAASATAHVAGTRRKFTVTKANEMHATPAPRREAENLRHLTERTNAATIHFPCSSSTQRQPLAGLFSSRVAFNPHLDKRFFDSSLVEVRVNATSSQSLDNNATADSAAVTGTTANVRDNIWQPRISSPDSGSVSVHNVMI